VKEEIVVRAEDCGVALANGRADMNAENAGVICIRVALCRVADTEVGLVKKTKPETGTITTEGRPG